MLRAIFILTLAFLLVFQSFPATADNQTCVTTPGDNENYDYYFPLIMANISAFENIESLVRQPADFPFDGWALEVFPETITVRLVGTNQIKRSVMIPDHIPADKIRKGVPVRLGEHMGQPILLAILPQLQNEINYSGKGTVIPNPPAISVSSTRDGWVVTWAAVPGADRYQVYRNDTADETSPDEVGYVEGTSITVPYESPYVYFAVRSISGLNESQLSGWITDNTPPPAPNTFVPTNDIAGHTLTISASDVAATDQGFKCIEIQQADDESGSAAASIGEFFFSDFPVFRSFGPGSTKYYRARSLDWAGNASAWTAWDDAWSLNGLIQDKFDGYGKSAGSPLESLYWLRLGQAEGSEVWYVDAVSGSDPTLTNETSNIKEGVGAKRSAPTGTVSVTTGISTIIDMATEGRFNNDDYVVFSIYASNPTNTTMTGAVFYGGIDDFSYGPISLSLGWNHIAIKRSSFTPTLPDSAYLTTFSFRFQNATNNGDYLVFDDIRLVKADPDNANTYNDTGRAWDKSGSMFGADFGEWHIYEGNRAGEPSKPFSYGQIKTAATPSTWYLSHKPLNSTEISAGTIQAGIYVKGIDGQGGLAFFIKDVTAGSWDMYAVEADSAADLIRLVRWVDGTRTEIATALFTFAPDQILWLGADFKDYDADGGRIRVYASLSEGNLIQASKMVISTQDTNVGSGGSAGLLSYQANVRFVNFVAGSPEHAEAADVAFALDGPVLGPLVFSLGDELTIASGIIQVSRSFHTVDTEADAATDDLVTINGGVDGMCLILQAANSARTVVCRDATGNLSLAGDHSLDNAADTITLFRRGGIWYELARSSNAA